MIEYCLEKKLIERSEIKYVLLPSRKCPANEYNDFIKYVYDNFGELSKLAVNTMIGCFNIESYKTTNSMYINNMSEASYYHHFKNATSLFRMQTNNELYKVNTTKQIEREEIESIIYHMILDVEAIELHKLCALVEEHKGTVVYLNTDAVSCQFPNDKVFDITKYYWDAEKEVPKYKFEEKKLPKTAKLNEFMRTDTYEFTNPEYTIVEEQDNFKKLAKKIINLNQGCHIDGRAGTGKSTLLRCIMERLQKKNIKYISLAPTNKACPIINGMTIHKFKHAI